MAANSLDTWFDEVINNSLSRLSSSFRNHNPNDPIDLSAGIEVVNDMFSTIERLSDDEVIERLSHLLDMIEVGPGQEEINDDSIERLKKNHGFKYQGYESGTCSVCLEDFSGDLIRLPSCSHHYHEACILSWLKNNKNSCPLCRSKIL